MNDLETGPPTAKPKLADRIAGWKQFFTAGLWEADLAAMSRWRRIRLQQARIWMIVSRSLVSGALTARASSLTYTTLLSIIPLLAVAFSMFKAFGGLEKVQEDVMPWIVSNLGVGSSGQVETYIQSFIKNIHSGRIGGVAVLGLFVTVTSLLTTIERAFNEIWGVKALRPLFQRVTNYTFLVVVGPPLLAFTLSVTATLKSEAGSLWLVKAIPHGKTLLGLTPIVITWLNFSLLYKLMPNTTVRWPAALYGGVLGGSLWELMKYVYIILNANNFKNNAIYGSLATIPVFMIWVYITWAIVLLGAQLSFAMQNASQYELEEGSTGASPRFKEYLSLRLVLEICQDHWRGADPRGLEKMAQEISVPPRLLKDVATVLVAAKLIRQVEGRKEIAFAPGVAMEKITVDRVIDAMRDHGLIKLKPGTDADADMLRALLDKAARAERAVLQSANMHGLAAKEGKAQPS